MYMDSVNEQLIVGSGKPQKHPLKKTVNVSESVYGINAVATNHEYGLIATADEINEVCMHVHVCTHVCMCMAYMLWLPIMHMDSLHVCMCMAYMLWLPIMNMDSLLQLMVCMHVHIMCVHVYGINSNAGGHETANVHIHTYIHTYIHITGAYVEDGIRSWRFRFQRLSNGWCYYNGFGV